MCLEEISFVNVFCAQLHLKRKTAWTNSSLLGCRISCLVDYREWHEGVVTQFHKSGKHFVEFRLVNEKRWLLMRKIAFYIVQRPPVPVRHFGSIPGGGSDSSGLNGEFKDSSGDFPSEVNCFASSAMLLC